MIFRKRALCPKFHESVSRPFAKKCIARKKKGRARDGM
jgi:hypothetical protein